MEKKLTDIDQTRIERALTKIGSQIADATELSQKAKELSSNAELLLIAAQQELEALYLSLEQQERTLSIYRDASSRS